MSQSTAGTRTEDPLQPTTLEAVQDAVRDAMESGRPLEVIGGGSKRFYGPAVDGARTLSLAGLRGIVDYQPHELILVVRPGTPLAEVEATLADAHQQLAFEPPHWDGPGWEAAPGTATVGGVIGCNLSGPRRPKAGAARDHLLGFQAVTGTGESVRGGGRVVKNVTGYDLPKLLCGSFGTLAVLTELVLKVLPAAETESTLLFADADAAAGVARMVTASRTQHEPGAMAHLGEEGVLPAAAAQAGVQGPLTAIRLEGPEPSVRQRAQALGGDAATVLEGEASREFWRAVRELEPLPLGAGERLWRISVPPAAGDAVGQKLRALGGRTLYDWGGGLLWCVLPANRKPPIVHALAREHGGHAQVVRHGADCPREAPLFAELTPGLRRLHDNLKRSFDPHGILNPGRMDAGR